MITDLDAGDLLRFQEEDSQLFETIVNRIYREVLRLGDTCVDGGASTGLHTLPLSRLVGPAGSVFAFEPVPTVADALERALSSYGMTNVLVSREALFHERRPVRFTIVANALSRSGIAQTPSSGHAEISELDVPAIRMDDALEDIRSLRFCKLDLEGAEFRALQGAERLLGRHRPLVVFERSLGAPSWYGYTVQDFFAFFDELRYRVLDLFGRPLTRATWSDPKRPWYAIAVASDGDDERLLRARLPAILSGLLERYRHPIGDSDSPPDAAGPFVWAAPNPVPAGQDAGTARVHWTTGDGSMGEVYVSVNDGEERLFFRGSAGSRPAPWINAWGSYEFRLYGGCERSELLAAVTVTRRKGSFPMRGP